MAVLLIWKFVELSYSSGWHSLFPNLFLFFLWGLFSNFDFPWGSQIFQDPHLLYLWMFTIFNICDDETSLTSLFPEISRENKFYRRTWMTWDIQIIKMEKDGSCHEGEGVSSATYLFWNDFFNKPFRIIPWLWKRVLHLVWALYYVYIVVEMTLNMAK